MPNLAETVRPLEKLLANVKTKKEFIKHWTPECEAAFERAREKLADFTMLVKAAAAESKGSII